MAIALLDRKSTLEAAAQQSQADSAPSEADLKLDEQVRRIGLCRVSGSQT